MLPKKTEIITTKTTPTMKRKIQARAEELGVNVAEYIRGLIAADMKQAQEAKRGAN